MSAETPKKRSLSVAKAITRTTPMVIRQSPVLWVFTLALTILSGAIAGISAPANERLFTSLADLATPYGAMAQVFLAAFIVVGLMSIERLQWIVGNYLYWHRQMRVTAGMHRILNLKMSLLPAQVFEDKNHLDDIEKAGQGMHSSMNLFQKLIDLFFRNGTFFIVMGAYLWGIQPILLVALALIFVPSVLSQFVQAKIYADRADFMAPINRKETCYYFHARDVRETRLFGIYNHFHTMMLEARHIVHAKEWEINVKTNAIQLGLNLIQSAGWVGIVMLLVRGLIAGDISVGAFAAVFGAVGNMFGWMNGLINQIRNSVTNQLGPIHNFIRFMDLPETTGKGDSSETSPDYNLGAVTASGLSFAYPGTEKLAVDNINLTIRRGETIALVGHNGSGKTTLVKLLCGLYKPDSGMVSVGGCDTVLTSDKALFKATSAVFQNFVQYGTLTLEDNVRIAERGNAADVSSYLDNADMNPADAATFPDGLNTMMSREFGGAQLSGGQWQRIAMARGMFRQHEFIILDEPTAAIDPLEETRVYKQFAEFARDKTAVLVTHRLGSARIADRIVVMDHGRIVESGTHEALLANGAQYAEMWEAQAAAYVEDVAV